MKSTPLNTVAVLLAFLFVVAMREQPRAQTSPSPATAGDVPAGTIIAYGGEKVPSGWLICDGRCFSTSLPEMKPLFAAIQYAHGGDARRFCLPDLRGRFLRGVDGLDRTTQRDEENVDRAAPRNDLTQHGNKGNKVGSVQDSATALPRNTLKLRPAGAHSHGMNFEVTAGRSDGGVKNTVANPHCCSSPRVSTDGVGDHTHEIDGGDKETRPDNVSVNWLIKM